jgi:hypothetical protein
MDFSLMIFEGMLEQKALNFLSEIDSDINSRRAHELMNDILKDVLNNNLNILKIESTGNVGIALKSMVENSMLNTPQKRSIVALVSYYALTNHLNIPQHEKHPLLYINRAQLMALLVNAFVITYKEVIDEEVRNPYILDFKPSASFDIHMLILHDLYQHKSYNEYLEEYFQNILRKFSSKISLGNYQSPDGWGESYHTKINNIVKETIQKLMPLYSS